MFISDDSMNSDLMNYIQSTQRKHPIFERILDGFWIGAVYNATMTKVEWVAENQNDNLYNNWISSQIGYGCPNSGCSDNHGVKINPKYLYQWSAVGFNITLPFMCIYKCPAGFKWSNLLKICYSIPNKKL